MTGKASRRGTDYMAQPAILRSTRQTHALKSPFPGVYKQLDSLFVRFHSTLRVGICAARRKMRTAFRPAATYWPPRFCPGGRRWLRGAPLGMRTILGVAGCAMTLRRSFVTVSLDAPRSSDMLPTEQTLFLPDVFFAAAKGAAQQLQDD